MLDTAYSIETPEGIDLTLRPAGPMPRVLAYSIDLLIRWAVMLGVGMLLSLGGEFGFGFILIVYFLLEWFYPVFFEIFRQGMTPGKKSLGLRVINDDGTPVRWDASLVRNLLRAADFLPFAYVAGLISMVCSTHFRRLGDLAAGTLVVYSPSVRPAVKHDETGTRPVPLPLTADEQRALLDFAESRGRLSPQRQEELANLLTPITGKRDVHGVVELVRVANGLMGRE